MDDSSCFTRVSLASGARSACASCDLPELFTHSFPSYRDTPPPAAAAGLSIRQSTTEALPPQPADPPPKGGAAAPSAVGKPITKYDPKNVISTSQTISVKSSINFCAAVRKIANLISTSEVVKQPDYLTLMSRPNATGRSPALPSSLFGHHWCRWCIRN